VISATEERIERGDGPTLFLRSWSPPAEARAMVVIVPGFNSHSGYYALVAGELTAAGVTVFAIDLRGRGRSDGERFYVESFADYVADVSTAFAIARARQPELPVFLLGHSAGGVVACLFALENGAQLAGLISESFAYELPAPDFALAVIKGLSHIAAHAHVLRLKNADFSCDPEIVAAMDADPLIAGEAQPSETLAALVRADEQLRKGFVGVTLPVLILHGTDDKAARPIGSQHFHDLAGSADKTLNFYPGSFHDPLNDLDKSAALGDIRDWIDAHIADGTRAVT
jgi:alpha-beta hydrolase superfamily lysophospholipase